MGMLYPPLFLNNSTLLADSWGMKIAVFTDLSLLTSFNIVSCSKVVGIQVLMKVRIVGFPRKVNWVMSSNSVRRKKSGSSFPWRFVTRATSERNGYSSVTAATDGYISGILKLKGPICKSFACFNSKLVLIG